MRAASLLYMERYFIKNAAYRAQSYYEKEQRLYARKMSQQKKDDDDT